MPVSIRTYRQFRVHCAVTYNGGPFRGQELNYLPRQRGNLQAYGLHVQFCMECLSAGESGLGGTYQTGVAQESSAG